MIPDKSTYPDAESISSDLIQYLRNLYAAAFREIIFKNGNADNVNGFTNHAIPAYLIATTAVESFLNEVFLSPSGRSFFGNISTEKSYWEWLEKIELPQKLIHVPQLLLGRTFIPSRQPYQEMKILITIRNELIHFKMGFKEPGFVNYLQQRGIALRDIGGSWTHNISTLKGIWWAHNTACSTIRELISFSTPETHPLLAKFSTSDFYNEWSESFIISKAKEFLAKHPKSV